MIVEQNILYIRAVKLTQIVAIVLLILNLQCLTILEASEDNLPPPRVDEPIVDEGITSSPFLNERPATDLASEPNATTVEEPIGTSEKPAPETTTVPSTIEKPAPPEVTKKPIECMETLYCFNGGKCILDDSNYPHCLCLEGFYGNRCQTKDICKSVIVDSLTGDQICAKLDRACFKNDKFFRCSCHEDEYFIFKIIQSSATSNSSNNQRHDQTTDQMSSSDQAKSPKADPKLRKSNEHQLSGGPKIKRSKSERMFIDLLNQQSHPDSATFAYDIANDATTVSSQQLDGGAVLRVPKQIYLAECRKVDKCLGARCRQLSEVCLDGQCVCNRDAGYVSDPTDGNTCKLLDPCSMPSNKNDPPICGQAKCVATFNRDLFRCLCPVGHILIQIGDRKSSSVCAPLNDAICDVPLLNKCQHLCHIDLNQNTYRCSCFRGYKPGKRPGVDDHMCFFDEHSNEDPAEAELFTSQARSSDPEAGYGENEGVRRPKSNRPPSGEVVFRWYKIHQLRDPRFELPSNGSSYFQQSSEANSGKTKFVYDSRPKLVPVPPRAEEEEEEERTGELISDSNVKSLKPEQYLIRREPAAAIEASRDGWDEWDKSVAKMSAQERCNKMCGENRICILENGSTDSYRCICDRQGYVSIGDKCLHWCAAAEFSNRIRVLLYKYGCWTQVCRPTDIHPQLKRSKAMEDDSKQASDEDREFLRLSSWRPKFECDCSSSPFLKQDPETRLCQLDFRATLEPCLPGNVGYVDCVENKNAYCAVLHRSSWSFIKDLIHDKYKDNLPGKLKSEDPSSSWTNRSKSKQQAKLANEKLYTCVCSPDKKFLVDKPRNKERCVDECNMLNIECVRFNRMCRSASIAPDDFGRNNLVRYDLDGAVKMNFRRTGCECLPGFNVGPTQSVDFTLDDEDEEVNKKQSAAPDAANPQIHKDPDGYPMPDIVDSDDILDQAEHMRAKYINIDSSCLLDYDVVEFHASFKSPADFDPSWIKIKNPLPEPPVKREQSMKRNCDGHDNSSCSITTAGGGDLGDAPSPRSHHQSSNETGFNCDPVGGCQLRVPKFMQYNISDLHKNIVLVAQCEPAVIMQSLDAYQECIRYRYWIIQKLRRHYVDWRRVITRHLSETFDLMEGNIRLRVNRCEATLKSVSRAVQDTAGNGMNATKMVKLEYLDPMDPQSTIDADIDCELTLHSASDGSSPRYSRKVLLEKQLQRFIFVEPSSNGSNGGRQFGDDYYLMAPNMLIRRESIDQLAEHRKLFNPCESDYAYCDMQTDCHMVDTVNFTCTCKFGYTPIGSRDIYYGDSRKEVCEDIDECLFDVCKELAGVADCENTIGDYKCLCRNQYTGDNKRYCNHVCNTINCHHLHGKCRIVAPHHALCECEDGYKEADCSVQDPNVALRKANMIIVGSIFTSVLLLMITLAISLNSQLKKTKKKLKRLEAINATANLFELHTPQPFRPRMSKAS